VHGWRRLLLRVPADAADTGIARGAAAVETKRTAPPTMAAWCARHHGGRITMPGPHCCATMPGPHCCATICRLTSYIGPHSSRSQLMPCCPLGMSCCLPARCAHILLPVSDTSCCQCHILLLACTLHSHPAANVTHSACEPTASCRSPPRRARAWTTGTRPLRGSWWAT
jgi:hypothetical protein